MAIEQSRIDLWFGDPALPSSGKTVGPGPQEIRAKAKEFAESIIRNTPPSADQSHAVRKAREAMQSAFQAIVCG